MENIKHVSKKFLLSYRGLPNKKQYLEFFTALLSIPVLITVIVLNINSLRAQKPETPTPAPTQSEKIIVVPNPNGKQTGSSNGGTQVPCKQQIGPVDISSPNEGGTISSNPVSIDISSVQGYCAIVWSYRINGGAWSDYDDKSIALYNLPSGNIKLDIRVKSIVTGEEKMLTRNFTYTGGPTINPTLSQSQSSSSSAH